MRLLDLFSGAGGAAMGYYRAGFHDITGVDIASQKRYPFQFIQADALKYVAEHGHEYDMIHASPPCQAYSVATPARAKGNHAELIEPLRGILQSIGKPYVIENVSGARSELENPVMLCGTMFGLPLWRHRYFEIWPSLWLLTPPCQHVHRPITIHSGSNTHRTWEPVLCSGGGDGQRDKRNLRRPREKVDVIRWAMGIDWMTQAELTEAIPPVYCEWIGTHLLEHVLQPEAA